MPEDRRRPVASFEDLEVFQRAYRISLSVHRESLRFPKIEQFGLAEQLRRAARSIPANVAEGHGTQAQSTAEFKRFLLIAIGSADEMRVWLRYCLDLGYIGEAVWREWRDEYKEIVQMLEGLRRSWR